MRIGVKISIAVVLLLLFLISMTEARTPKVGDDVNIQFLGDLSTYIFRGIITDMDTNMICINCSQVKFNDRILGFKVGDVCIGIGQIDMLTWA